MYGHALLLDVRVLFSSLEIPCFVLQFYRGKAFTHVAGSSSTILELLCVSDTLRGVRPS